MRRASCAFTGRPSKCNNSDMVDSSSGQPQPDPTAASSSSVVAAATPAPRARRRRRPLRLLIAAGVLWAVGQGFGWFGSGPSGEKGDGDGLGRGATQAALAGDGLRRDDGPKSPKSNPQPGAGVSADRFASLMSLLESHLSEAELGSAAGTLQRLLKRPLSDAQRERVAALEVRLLSLKKACAARILEFVQSGEVLAADREAAQLVTGGVWQATELLAVVPNLTLASNWQGSIDTKAAAVPLPTPLKRDRQVRVRFRDQLRVGVVASSNRDEVTVRLVSRGGQTFPTVKYVSCEPASSTSSEAVEMGLAAVHAGSPRLARLWMLRVHLLKGELTPRGHQLLDVLR